MPSLAPLKLPTTLEDWTLDQVKALSASDSSENMDFDFKSGAAMLAASGISSLSKAVSAFANSRGGFIILGVTDKPPRQLDGVAGGPEFLKHLHERIKVYPAVDLPDPKMLPLTGGRFVAVLQVPHDDGGPYASTADHRAEFFVRTPGGAQSMNWVQIRDAMMRADERRRQADLLIAQFTQYYLTAKSHKDASREQHSFPETQFFDLTLTHAAFAALHPWLAKSPHAMQSMTDLLARMNYLNGQVQAMIADVAANPRRLADWRGRMAFNVGGFRDQLVGADANVRTALGLPHPHYPNAYPQY